MAILVTPVGEAPEAWRAAFEAAIPGAEIRLWPDAPDDASVEFAVVGSLPPGTLARFPRLRLIASIFAGQDRLLSDATLPAHVPIVRTDNPDGDRMMSEFALLHVLRHHRNLPGYAQAQLEHRWRPLHQPRTHERRVGIMGLGSIGLGSARAIGSLGFRVSGWARRPRREEGITVFHGMEQFPVFLAQSDILVNLLPLTAQTASLLDRRAFSALPRGASLINLGRGEHVVDDDLIAAIDSGQLVAATLDAFRVEPLPGDHPFWRNPAITITPHVARRLDIESIARRVALQVARLNENKPLQNVVDRAAGY